MFEFRELTIRSEQKRFWGDFSGIDTTKGNEDGNVLYCVLKVI